MSSEESATGGQQEEEVYEIERVYTHRGSDRTTHHIKAADERAAERRLERLEERGETDDLNNEIESMAGNPLHVHVHEAWDVDLSEVDDAE